MLLELPRGLVLEKKIVSPINQHSKSSLPLHKRSHTAIPTAVRTTSTTTIYSAQASNRTSSILPTRRHERTNGRTNQLKKTETETVARRSTPPPLEGTILQEAREMSSTACPTATQSPSASGAFLMFSRPPPPGSRSLADAHRKITTGKQQQQLCLQR